MISEYEREMITRLRASHPHWIIRLAGRDWLGEYRFDSGHIILASKSAEVFSQRMAELESVLKG